MEKSKKGIIFLFLAAGLWGFGGFFLRKIFDEGVSAFTFGLLGNFFVLLLFLIFCNKKIDFKITKPDFKKIALLSLSGTITFTTVVLAFKYTTIANAEFLHYTMPVFVLVMAIWFLREKLTLLKVLLSLLALIGIVLVFVEDLDFTSSLLGNSLALASALFYAFGIILARRVKHLDPYTISFWHILIGFGYLIIPAIVFFSGINSVAIFYIALNGIIGGFLGVLFYYKGLLNVEASVASIILLFEVVSASAIAWLLLGESLTWLSIAGGLLILASSAGLFLRMKKV